MVSNRDWIFSGVTVGDSAETYLVWRALVSQRAFAREDRGIVRTGTPKVCPGLGKVFHLCGSTRISADSFRRGPSCRRAGAPPASPNALHWLKHTKKKLVKPRSWIQTSRKTLKKFSATASSGTRQRGNSPPVFQCEDDTPTNTLT